MRQKIFLSKTKIKQNDQCSKQLWLDLNKKEEGFFDNSDQSKFIQGRDVEQIMRNSFPNAVLMNKIKNEEKIEQTLELLKTNNIIFEASFVNYNTIVQFDCLIKNSDGTYDAIEVKSGSSFKPDYLDDVTLQYYIATKNQNIKIKNYYVWYINKKSNSSNDEDFFIKENVIDKILSNKDRFFTLLNNALSTNMLKTEPRKSIGQHCSKPYTCKFWNYCSKSINQGADSVLKLPYFPNKYEAIEKGIESVNHPEFDKHYKYSEQNPHIIKAIRENKLVLNQDGIKEDLSKWKYPLNFFDFETLMGAIPILEGQKPFQQVVFQYSNHTIDKEFNFNHYEFLHESLNNPNKDVIESMLKNLDNGGSIVSYNKTFEMTRIKELAALNPEYIKELLSLLERFVDLMDIVKDHVYHPSFLGSYSLKSVSPTLLGYENGGYTDSIIKNGGEISKYYVEFLRCEDENKKADLKSALLKYCKYDTLNLVLLMTWLLDQNSNISSLVDKILAESIETKKAS